MLESLFNEVAGLKPATLLKEAPTQLFPWKNCEIFKNISFEEHLQTAAFFRTSMILLLKMILLLVACKVRASPWFE